MNLNLQKLFSTLYSTEYPRNEDGSSSQQGTAKLRGEIVELLQQHSVKSIFDAGCNDCNWMRIISEYVDYKGGDISLAMVAHCWLKQQGLDVILHDITTDPIPDVDLLFIRDVTIHLNNEDKMRVWKNWFSSNVPWILITHNQEVSTNNNSEYQDQQLLVELANWERDPWNFPAPKATINEYDANGKCMALWHRDQFKDIL